MIVSLLIVIALGVFLLYLISPRVDDVIGLFFDALRIAWLGWIIWLMIQATRFFLRVN